jgi:hypothetical protein
MQLAVFNFEITYRAGKINSANELFRRLDHEELNKKEINLSFIYAIEQIQLLAK